MSSRKASSSRALPLPFGNSERLRIGIEVSRDHFRGRPGELLVSEEDWLAAVALATTPTNRSDDDPIDVAAKVALWKAGLELTFPEERKKEVILHAAAILGGNGAANPSIADRIRQLMTADQQKKKEKKERAEQSYLRMRHLLPKGLHLLEHQKEALLEISDRNYRCVIHDDLGLGKTVEILCSLLLRSADEGRDAVLPMLILSTASVAGSWIEHTETWMKTLGVKVSRSFSDKEANVVVMPYGRLLEAWKDAKEFDPKSVVFDESHYLINPESQRSKAAILTSSSASAVLCATATMSPNGRPEESFLQLKLCDRSLDWRTYRYEWCGAFKMKIGTNAKGEDIRTWNTKGATNPVRFGRVLHERSFRRMKADMMASLGLPELARYVLPVETTPKLLADLQKMRDSIRESLEKKASSLMETGRAFDKITAEKILEAEEFAATTRLRMVVGRHKIPTAVARTKELLADGHRVVHFCFHPEVAIALHEKLVAAFPKLGDTEVLLGTSDLSPEERTELVRVAQATGQICVLTYAYCEGVTLTSFDRVLMVERHWIPDKELQAEARINRIGQTSEMAVEYLVCRGTIDDAMSEIHTLKENRSRSVVASAATRLWSWLEGRKVDDE